MLTTRSLNWTEGIFTFPSRFLCGVRRSRKKLKLMYLFIPDSVHGYLNEVWAILLRKDAFAQPRGVSKKMCPSDSFFDQFVLSCNI